MHGGVGAAVPAGRADAEHTADIFRRCLVHLAEHLVDSQHQVVADAHDQLLVLALLQFIVEDIQRIFDQFFVHCGQDTASVDAAAGGGVALGQVVHVDGLAAALGTAAQQVVTADVVVVRHLHHEGQAALADAFFVMGKLSLADAKVLRRLLLGDAALFAQQRDDPIKFDPHDLSCSGALPACAGPQYAPAMFSTRCIL